MVEEKTLDLVKKNLQRIFSMKITRTTFREVQNAILQSCEGNTEKANSVFETIVTGENKLGKKSDHITHLIEHYMIPIRLSKEIFERGEFINIITSDMLNQANRYLFLNRIRRVDGEEFQFLTDVESTASLLHHFTGRIAELKKADTKGQNLSAIVGELKEIKKQIEEILA